MNGRDRVSAYIESHSEQYGNGKPIFEILVFEEPCKEYMFERNGELIPSGYPEIGDNRMGYYHELDTAIQAMNENWADIQEHCFHAGFVLCHFPGLYNDVGPWGRIYFLWDEERMGFFEADEPPLFAHLAL